ncbi:MAG: sulfatase-like hydrolase/transferase [Bacteroidia bacterium]|nr:sulfatase-like hydrolase/transferase [Bacteroidia bacterium]
MGLFPGVNIHHFMVMILGGLRFDLSAVLYINLLFIFLLLIPFKFRHSSDYQKRLDYLFYTTNAIGLALNCIDFIYYRFTQRRTTIIVFDEFKNEQNYLQLAKHFFLDYYYILLLWIFLIAVMVWLSRKLKVDAPKLSGIKYYASNTIILAAFTGLIVIGLRSGLPPKQDFPLVPSDAGQYTVHPNDVAIVQNTPFCMLRTSRMQVYEKQNYFSEQELASIYSPVHHPDSVKEFKKMNVVVIIVESLCKEALGYYNRQLDNGTYKGYTPFLDSLAEHSLVFMNSFANSRVSIEASPALLAGIPSLQESFTQSFYSNNAINSLATCLSTKGYETVFAHGAPNGSLGLNAFTVMAGINKYIGKDEYGNDADYDGVWGIWDHKFLPFFARECTKLQQPFLASVFTVSSHHPFKLPAELDNRFSEGPIPIFRSLRYADYSLQKFFDEASRQPWFENTIFVITGDHISGRYYEEYKTSLGAFGVPLIFYTPGNQLLARKDFRVAQQIDVMPTILNYLGFEKPYFAFGKDLFDDQKDKISINYIGNAFQLIWDNWVIQHNTTNTVALFDRVNDPLLKNNLVGKNDTVQARMERKVKAFIQQHNNRMADNRMLP